MIRVQVRHPDQTPPTSRPSRRRFGLDAPMPADPWVIERAVLRHLAACRPAAVVLSLLRVPGQRAQTTGECVDLSTGVPELMLLLPGGRLAFLVIKTQARKLTRPERAFADVCRARAVPVHVVRSLAEARQALDQLGLPSRAESSNAIEESGHPWRPGPLRP